MSLYSVGLSALNAAELALGTTSHNINNATTPGYSRQRLLTSTAGATATANGFIGRGVQVDTVQRQYDSFLYRQLVGGQGQSSELGIHYDQLSQINSLFSDRTVGITPALQNFFKSMNAAASSPADGAVRQDLIGNSNSLVSQLNSSYQQLENQRNGLNVQISTTVEQVNSYLERINDLNKKIVVASGKGGGHAPNDLLDQRDLALSELNQLVGINFYPQGDSVNVTLSSGQTLLTGETVFKLSAVPSGTDPMKTSLAYSLPSGAGGTVLIEIPDNQISGGKLGGYLKFRHDSLDPLQDQLGQFAIGLALSVNAQHEQGFDLNGNPGGKFFGLTADSAVRNAGNLSTAEFSTEFMDANAIKASAYSIEFDGTDYRVTRLSDNSVVYGGPAVGARGELEFDGLKITLNAAVPQAGDKWELRAARNAARDIDLLVQDTNLVALSDTANATANGANGLKLAQLQTEKVLGNGSLSLNEMFSQLINTVGVKTQYVKTASTAQDKLTAQQLADQQSVSGVNLNEEYVNLTIFNNQYQASARIIDAATTVFDTIIGLRR